MTQISPFLLLNGILNEPDDMFTWTDRSERLLQLEHGIISEKIEYHIGVIRRPSRLKKLSSDLAEVINDYNMKGQRANAIAHSNGNVLMCRALRAHPGIKIDTLFMLMPACWASMEENGLNLALKRGQIKRIVCFGSDDDRVVKWGGKTGFLKWMGLGYGTASHTGLTEIDPEIADRVKQVRKEGWGHSTFGQYDVLEDFIKDEILSEVVELQSSLSLN